VAQCYSVWCQVTQIKKTNGDQGKNTGEITTSVPRSVRSRVRLWKECIQQRKLARSELDASLAPAGIDQHKGSGRVAIVSKAGLTPPAVLRLVAMLPLGGRPKP
jgi:hypothetical protein